MLLQHCLQAAASTGSERAPCQQCVEALRAVEVRQEEEGGVGHLKAQQRLRLSNRRSAEQRTACPSRSIFTIQSGHQTCEEPTCGSVVCCPAPCHPIKRSQRNDGGKAVLRMRTEREVTQIVWDLGACCIHLGGDIYRRCGPEGQSKRPRTSSRTALKTSGGSKDVLPSFYDNLPKHRSSCNATSRRDKANQDKLDTNIFELYMEHLWKHIDEEKKSAYAYFDSLWFNMYYCRHNIPSVLQWIKAKKIFSRQYVFVPIVCFGHWSLLVLCHFDDANCSDVKKGPRMIVLDSLNMTDPTRLRSTIRKFIIDIYKTEEREESKQFINKIRLEFPKVPQQNGEECGIYVLYFIRCFLQNKKLAEALDKKNLEEDFTQLLDDGWFDPEEIENLRKDIHSFQANRNNKIAE